MAGSRRSDYGQLGLVARIAQSCGLTIYELARYVGEPARELERLERATRGQIVEVNRDDLWAKLDAFVSERLGLLMSVREELARKLENDRRRQLAARSRVEDRL